MIVEKKSVQFVDEKEQKGSSMMVSQKVAEDKLYNLMRGHTSLMIAADSDSSEDEGEEGSEDDENNESSEAVPDERKKKSVNACLVYPYLSLDLAFSMRGAFPLLGKPAQLRTREESRKKNGITTSVLLVNILNRKNIFNANFFDANILLPRPRSRKKIRKKKRRMYLKRSKQPS